MQQVKLIENRKDYRYNYLAEISYGSNNGTGKGFVRDISKGGIQIVAERNIPVGTVVLITIPLPTSIRNISVHGSVVRITDSGFAVSFKRRGPHLRVVE